MKKGMFVGLMALVCAFGSAGVSLAKDFQALKKNTDLLPQPVAYTTLFLPPNYQSDPTSQDVLRGFYGADSTLADLKNVTTFTTYTSDDPDFRDRWVKKVPAVDQGKPAVLVTLGGKKLLFQEGTPAKTIADEVKASQIVEKCRPFKPCPSPKDPEVKPEDPVTPEAPITPTNPVIAPTQPVAPPVEEVETGKVVAILGGAAAAVWMAFFRRRM